jgi:hypothetical protein
MNKQLIFGIIIGFLLIGIAIAGELSIKNYEEDKAIIDAIKKDANIDKISITSSPIACDDTYCYSRIYQEGLVNVNWQYPKGTLTTKEIEDERDKFITDLIKGYGNNLIGINKPDKITDETKIDINEKK